jgi:hypothetical protein
MKTTTLFLAFGLFALTACSGNVSDPNDAQGESESAPSPQSDPATEGASTGHERAAVENIMSDTPPGPTGAPAGAGSTVGSGSQGPTTPHVHTLQ